tara:strand:+ start:3046 stop:5181 length:2136 start_codon:yes stop_codon:yes gene_type:complete
VSRHLIALQLILFLFQSELGAGIDDYYRFYTEPSPSNYGNTGLMEVPNARFSKPASLRINYSSSFPFEHTSITGTPFSWLEATYRYTEVENRLYGPLAYSGNQSFKDKGFDIKIGLLQESYYFPEVALGIRDLAGTGLFSSEFLVASKRFNNFDFSLGLGWGILGKESNLSNPLNSLHDSFNIRDSSSSQGGEFSYKDWFSGETALFGGLEYELKKYGLRFKLEYDTTRPDRLPNGTLLPLPVDSKINAGVTFFPSNQLSLTASYERGNQLRFSFSLKGNFLEDTIPKPAPKNVIRLNEEQIRKSIADKSIFFRSLNKSLRDESIFIQGANYKDKEVDLAVASTKYFSMTREVGRSARVVSALASPEVEKINISSMNGDLQVATFSINRQEFDSADKNNGSLQEILKKSKLYSNSNKPLYLNADFKPTPSFPEIEWNMSPSISHQIGGPEGFYLGQLSWLTDISIKFRRNISLYTSLGINIYDTFKDFNNPSASTIPHVRSDIQDYLSQGKNNIRRMQLEYLSSPMKDVFFRADFGIFEQMFAGVGGEILHRPFNRRFSYGLSYHKVKQRDYDQLFSFLDYSTDTGHFSFNLDLPSEVSAKLLVGKYLAKDKGATLDLSRRFQTGFTLGIFATKTNLSAEEFGEGSFDKGFYFSIPTQLFYSDFRSGNISFGIHPLTKDGGAILNNHHTLHGLVGDTSLNSIIRDWNYLLD